MKFITTNSPNASKWISFSICVVFLASLVGCGGDSFAPVSGVVTFDGEPVEGLVLSFMPIPPEGSNVGGPFSEGFTDASGKFTLVTRYGDPGAVVGKHSVSINYEIEEDEGMEVEFEEGSSAEERQALIEEAKAAKKKRIKIPNKYRRGKATFEVVAGGNADANFELSSGKKADKDADKKE